MLVQPIRPRDVTEAMIGQVNSRSQSAVLHCDIILNQPINILIMSSNDYFARLA
jgi:hypothetical protein